MPILDSAAVAALNSDFAPAFFIFLDILGDPIRVTTYGPGATFAATGDSDLDGTYSAVDPTVLTVSDVSNQDSGSDTVTITLSGITSIDTALMTEIGNQAQWRARVCRLWMQIHDMSGAAQGAIVPYYTGYMSAVTLLPSPTTQTIQLKVENYLAAFNQASNRSYQSQTLFDPSDTSSAALLAAANGSTPGGAISYSPGDAGANLGPITYRPREVNDQ